MWSETSSSSSLTAFSNQASSPWSTWRQSKDVDVDLDVHLDAALPTPPSSVPLRKLVPKQHQSVEKQQQLPYLHPSLNTNQHIRQNFQQQSMVSLPTIKQLDRQLLCPSPLTPPDDETSPFWHTSRARKPGYNDTRHLPVASSSSNSLVPSPMTYSHPHPRTPDLVSPASESDSPSPLAYPPNCLLSPTPSRPNVHINEQMMSSRAYEAREQYEEERDIEPMDAYVETSVPTVIPPASQHLVEWLTTTQKRSAHFIAEKTCEMICYLWFSSNVVPAHSPSGKHRRTRRQQKNASPSFSGSGSVPNSQASAVMQFNATAAFVDFMQKLLETTQVSQSVIVLSLHYVYRLKEKNHDTIGRQGSEFRVAVVSLMLANKFVDDNTYTNKTWSDVSGISLTELNKMEREFLQGVDFRLFVDKSTYESWLNLLKGLVLAKERDSQNWRYAYTRNSRRFGMGPKNLIVGQDGYNDCGPVYSQEPAYTRARKASLDSSSLFARARSTSPHSIGGAVRSAHPESNGVYSYDHDNRYPFTFNVPPPVPYASSQIGTQSLSHLPSASSDYLGPYDYNETARPTSAKRSATDAFSPASAAFPTHAQQRPLKQQLRQRPVSLMLNMDAIDSVIRRQEARSANPALDYDYSGNHSFSPSTDENTGNRMASLDGLQSFERMSLDPASAATSRPHTPSMPAQDNSYISASASAPRMLAAPYEYTLDGSRRLAPPQNLYFYTLASSPATDEYNNRQDNQQEQMRKARLRYHQPHLLPPISPPAYTPYPQQYPPQNISPFNGSYPPSYTQMNGQEAYAQNGNSQSYMPLDTPSSLILPPMHTDTHHYTNLQRLRAYNPFHTVGVQLPPLIVQSARTSPREGYDRFLLAYPHGNGRGHSVVLPHLRDAMWAVASPSNQGSSAQLPPPQMEATRPSKFVKQFRPPQAEGWDINDEGGDVDVDIDDSCSQNGERAVDADDEMEGGKEYSSASVRQQQLHSSNREISAQSYRTSPEEQFYSQQMQPLHYVSPLHRSHSGATPAPFANAGPPGIHFYAPLVAQATPASTPVSYSRTVDATATMRAPRFY